MTRLTQDAELKQALSKIRRIAVIGAKSDGGPAQRIPEYLKAQGYDVVPVNPKGGKIAGLDAVADLESAGDVDAVVLFRRSDAIPLHQDEVIRAKPKLAWMQLGISNESTADAWTQAGIDVVQDKCIFVEHRRLFG